MSRCWSAYEGLSVGVWELESFLGERDNAAFFTAKNPRRAMSALVKLIDASAPEASARTASWREAARLSHPALLAVHDLGEAELDGAPVAYAALDLPHDDLSEAVARRLLTAEEARSTFASVARALDYLHARGLRHNAVQPENIFLVGDEVKLGVDALTPANGGAESDLRQFGGALVYAMTGLDVKSCNSETADGLPPPVNEIAAGCLNGATAPNWNARRIADVLAGQSDKLLPGQPGASEAERRPMRRRFSPAVFGAIASGVIAAYLFSGRHSQPPAETHAAKPASAAATAPARPVEKPDPARVAEQPPAKGAPAPHRPAARPIERAEADRVMERPSAPPRAAAASSKGSWAVIAATYSSFGAAAKRADALRKLSPRLRPHIFPREGEGRRYYVVLGSSLTQDAAQRLRALATSLGAPKDTYVTKLDES